MYRLRTFGGLAVELDGTVLDHIGAHRKALALLAVLAARGSGGREHLGALLWPESDAGRAKGSLNQAVHLLRRQFDAPDLLLGTVELRLNPERIESDVGMFSRALEEGDAAVAVGLYSGSFLDGVHVRGAPDFEGWAEVQRAELERRYMGALEQLAKAAEARGDYVSAVAWWSRLQRADPLNGRVAVSLMLALDASGDRAAALEHARLHEATLREEWGITADPSVQSLADRLRSPAPPAAPETERITMPNPGLPAWDQRELKLDQPVGRRKVIAAPPRRTRVRKPTLLALILLLGLAGAAAGVVSTRGRAALQGARGPQSPPTSAPATRIPERGSIAVLPFLDLSPQGDQEHFSDGITEELITALYKVEGLKVAARTSAFQFKGRSPDVREVGELLGVVHVLEGSVRKAGDRMRIDARLTNAASGYHLWSETYERRLSDVFAVQEEISRAIVEALQMRLGEAEGGPLVPPPTKDFDAYEMYLKGLHFLNRLQIPQAVGSLEDATRRDPQFARAYAALAEAYAVPAAYSDGSPLDNRGRGLAAAAAALRLDPSLADAHAALGWLEMIGLRWDEAERALRLAVELDPRAPRARLYYGLYLHRQGRLDDAVAELRRARELDPLSSPINAVYGSFLGDLGLTDEAVAHLQATLELDPSFPIAHAVLAHIYMGTGRSDEAIHHYERVAATVPTSFYAGFLGHAYAHAGRTRDARRVLAELEAQTGRGDYASPGAIGWVLLGLDEREDAFRWLERAVKERDVFLTVYGALSNAYLSGPFRDDPRFQEIRTSVGLAP